MAASELREALVESLESRGVLRDIKARLRAEICRVLDDPGQGRPSLPPENLIINELIREYLEYNRYHQTLSVFLAESGQPETPPFDRRFLATELRLEEDFRTQSLPILYGLVHGLQSQLPAERLSSLPKRDRPPPSALTHQAMSVPTYPRRPQPHPQSSVVGRRAFVSGAALPRVDREGDGCLLRIDGRTPAVSDEQADEGDDREDFDRPLEAPADVPSSAWMPSEKQAPKQQTLMPPLSIPKKPATPSPASPPLPSSTPDRPVLKTIADLPSFREFPNLADTDEPSGQEEGEAKASAPRVVEALPASPLHDRGSSGRQLGTGESAMLLPPPPPAGVGVGVGVGGSVEESVVEEILMEEYRDDESLESFRQGGEVGRPMWMRGRGK
ncbi:unnamed protein product [Vitrella brassicaformis CCMP3155]|uniref:Centrosomal protein 20 n=1 Tax=Vitrella brassicaformis (strain CCMP3155) TaxID=1169540 RepID=A0A0G4H6S8_VITBC|nr:unnamed protein product [Vitrella brassicaformis CCMP3155]|eukprot:CEM39555.1 unnamed protein product [Vitrella brassicaformis CCMP3155]